VIRYAGSLKRKWFRLANNGERDGKIPREIFRRMGALGFLGMRHQVEYGGTEMGPLASMVFAEELGRSTFGGFTSSTLVHSDMSAVHITLRGTAKQKEKYLPAIIRGETICSIAVTEPDAGSDVAGLKTRARRDGDSWVINGSKMFITNAVYGDILIVAAPHRSRGEGQPRNIAVHRRAHDTRRIGDQARKARLALLRYRGDRFSGRPYSP